MSTVSCLAASLQVREERRPFGVNPLCIDNERLPGCLGLTSPPVLPLRPHTCHTSCHTSSLSWRRNRTRQPSLDILHCSAFRNRKHLTNLSFLPVSPRPFLTCRVKLSEDVECSLRQPNKTRNVRGDNVESFAKTKLQSYLSLLNKHQTKKHEE